MFESESTRPLVGAVRLALVGPPIAVFDGVVVAAGRGEVVGGGGSACGEVVDVVEVTVDCRHAAAGEHAGRCGRPDRVLLGGGGAASGGADGDQLAGVTVVDRVLPPAAVGGRLAGEVGDDGTEPG